MLVVPLWKVMEKLQADGSCRTGRSGAWCGSSNPSTWGDSVRQRPNQYRI